MYLTVTASGPAKARITIMDTPATARLAGTRELRRSHGDLNVLLKDAARDFLLEYWYVTTGSWKQGGDGSWTIAVEPAHAEARRQRDD